MCIYTLDHKGLRATRLRPCVADWGGGISACGFNCSLMWALDGHIMFCTIISLYQSTAILDVVKHCWPRV